MPGPVGGRPGVRRLLVSSLPHQPAVPGQQRRWRNREDGGPAPAGTSRASAASRSRSADPYRTPAGVAAQHRVLVAEHERLGILRRVAAGYQDSEA